MVQSILDGFFSGLFSEQRENPETTVSQSIDWKHFLTGITWTGLIARCIDMLMVLLPGKKLSTILEYLL